MRSKSVLLLMALLMFVLAFAVSLPASAVPPAALRIADSYFYAASSLHSPVNATTTFTNT